MHPHIHTKSSYMKNVISVNANNTIYLYLLSRWALSFRLNVCKLKVFVVL